MNTIENNTLIAEFMRHRISQFYAHIEAGGTYPEVEKYWTNHGSMSKYGNIEVQTPGRGIAFRNLCYHDSWDWLMPVVEKIKQYCLYKVEDVGGDYKVVFIDNSGYNPSEQKMFMFSDKDYKKATYKAVVEFIKWYNKNKED